MTDSHLKYDKEFSFTNFLWNSNQISHNFPNTKGKISAFCILMVFNSF